MSSKLFTEAISAIDGAITSGLERHLGSAAAGCANSFVHRAVVGAPVGGGTFAGIAAGLAALGLVGESFFSIEFLLVGRKGELLSAIFADDNFVLIHLKPRLFLFATRRLFNYMLITV